MAVPDGWVVAEPVGEVAADPVAGSGELIGWGAGAQGVAGRMGGGGA